MAENIHPLSSHQHLDLQNDSEEHPTPSGKSPSKSKHLKHVDFTALRKGKAPMAPRKSNVVHPQEDGVSNDIETNTEGGDGIGNGNEKDVPAQIREDVAAQMETQRLQLISPPPEEVLHQRRLSSGRASAPVAVTVGSSMPTSATTPAKTTTKRKRAAPSPMKPSTSASSADDSMNEGLAAFKARQLPNATPNPKPRKQRHISSQSVESPTRGSFELTDPVVSSSNRKATDGVGTTPTKPKKKVVIQSPHTRNAEADYIPPLVLNTGGVDGEEEPLNPARRALLSARGSRRSATPIPAYEPPSDVFTPPREVYMSPPPPKSVSKSSKRKVATSGGHGSVKSANKKGLKVKTSPSSVAVKQELPDDIDLRAPMPPASPTDDPLLLSGPPDLVIVIDDEEQADSSSTPTRERRRSVSAHTQTQDEVMRSPLKEGMMPPPAVGQPMGDDGLPPSSPEPPLDSEEAAAIATFDMERRADQYIPDQSTDDSMMVLDDPNDAEIEPVPLFDFGDTSAGGGGWSDSDDDGPLKTGGNDEEGEGEFTGKWTMRKVRTKEDPPSSATKMRQDLWGRPVSPFPKMKPLTLLNEEDNDGAEQEEEEEVRRMSVEPDTVEVDEAEEEEEERQVHEMSMELEEEILFPNAKESLAAVILPDVADDDDDTDDDTDTDDDSGLVKITSMDPRAAARAVAILKQHDYDCYTKLKKRRASYSTADDLAKHSRKRDVVEAGISKSTSKAGRRSTMGVLGDIVIIPGTPKMTLPELLSHAENEVYRCASPSSRPSTAARVQDPFKTPLPHRSNFLEPTPSTTPHLYPVGERGWAKDDWKLLDACFTDLRLELGDFEDGLMAEVEAVNLDDVVSRFVDMMGGRTWVDTFGESWSNNNILERSRALQNKQRSGHVAPPTTPFATRSSHPTPSTSITDPHKPTWASILVPEFTPLSRGLQRPSQPWNVRAQLPCPVQGGLFSALPTEGERSHKRLPSSLLAPRYSHLLDEAVDIAKSTPHPTAFSPQGPRPDTYETTSEEVSPVELERGEDEDDLVNVAESSAIGARVRGFFTSYLPLLSKPPSSSRSLKDIGPTRPGFPLPPKDILEKPRGPINTPARPPAPRPPHPKDIVQLNPAPLPPSNIPRPKVAPRRMVELHHVSPQGQSKEDPNAKVVPRARRSSASSVKDLVQGFEKIQEIAKGSDIQSFKRTGSLSNLKEHGSKLILTQGPSGNSRKFQVYITHIV